MRSTSEKVLQLRQMLAERFGNTDLEAKSNYPTGLAALDDAEISVLAGRIHPLNSPAEIGSQSYNFH